jgi:single-strand DNA-binding protein
MLNTVVLMGRLCADPELRYTPSNVPVTNFTLAVERPFKQGDERQTDFIDVVVWRHTAEFVCRYFKKGQLIAVEGQIQTRSYTDKDGNNRKAFEVLANRVHFAGDKRESTPTAQQPAQAFESGNLGDFEEIEEDDELPF